MRLQTSSIEHPAAFWIILLVVMVFRGWFGTLLPLSGDEAYHWEWSRNPAPGYYDHPGLTAYVIGASTRAFGRSTEFTVRFTATVLLGLAAIACWLLGRSVAYVRGLDAGAVARCGFWSGLAVLAVPIFACFGVYMSTDPPLIAAWAWSLYFAHAAFLRGGLGNWALLGVCVGLALFSKLLGVLLCGGLFFFALISREDRRQILSLRPYVAVLLACLVFLPCLLWNYRHDWAMFMFNFVYRQNEQGFNPVHVPEFLLGQAAALSPFVFVGAVAGLARLTRGRWRLSLDRSSLLLLASSAVPAGYFLAVSLKRRVGLHWPAAGWLGVVVWLICAHAYEAGWLTGKARRVMRWAVWSCIGLTVALHLLALVPMKGIVGVWRLFGSPSGLVDPSDAAERYGWHELGAEVARVRSALDKESGDSAAPAFVICPDYGLAAAVSFYMPDQARAHLWSRKRIHGENYRFWDDFSALAGRNAVFVAKTRTKAQSSLAKLSEHFEKVGDVEEFVVPIDGWVGRSFFLVRCNKFNGVAPVFESMK